MANPEVQIKALEKKMALYDKRFAGQRDGRKTGQGDR
jgi:hypothetical protein